MTGTYRNLIFDLSGVMGHNKCVFPLVRNLVVFVRLQKGVQLFQHRLIGAVVDVAFLVYEPQQAVWLVLNKKKRDMNRCKGEALL